MEKKKIRFHDEVKRKRRFFLLKSITLIVTGISVFVLVIYLLFYSALFSIRSITISGTRYTDKQALQKMMLQYAGKNIFSTSIDISAIKHRFPAIESLAMHRIYPATLVIAIHEYPPLALIQAKSLTYVIASNGLVIDMVSNASTKYILPLVVAGDTGIAQLPLADIAHFINVIESDKHSFVTTFSFTYPYLLKVSYDDGHTVYFSIHKDILVQLKQVAQIKSLLGFSKCKNVDVRFDNVYCS